MLFGNKTPVLFLLSLNYYVVQVANTSALELIHTQNGLN